MTHDRFWSKVDKSGGPEACWPWTASCDKRNRYGKFWQDGGMRPAHIVAYEEAHGPVPQGMKVLHRCDNPPCCNQLHLFTGTQADNVADMDAKGRRNPTKGSAHHKAKLTEAQVSEIRKRYVPHCPVNGQAAMAREFNVARNTIIRAMNGENWQHVEEGSCASE